MQRKLPSLQNSNLEIYPWVTTHGQMNGGSISSGFGKNLTVDNLNQNLSRVIINMEEMNTNLISEMTESEKTRMKLRKGLPVVAIDLTGQQYEVVIKWCSCSINEYVLIGNWNHIVQNYQLEVDDSVFMYFFRRGDGGLCLIIEGVKRDGQ